MKVSYYPGCSLEGTARSYDRSTHEVCRSLGVELEDVPRWSCCGSSPALKMNGLLSVSLAAHNIALAQQQSLSDLVAPCPFCFRRLRGAQEDIARDGRLRERVEQTIEAKLDGTTNIHNLLGFIRDRVGLDEVTKRVKKPLKGLRVVPYYGCYLVRPPEVAVYDDPENPVSLDELLSALGAEVVDWDFKTECCGAGLSLSKTETVCRLSGRIVREAAWREADAIVVVCQLCQANLDMRQGEISAMFGKNYQVPIVYFTQLMGLSFGRSPGELGLQHHIVDPLAMLKGKGFAG
jgi:heterodisulfide reductase subunit B2